MYILQLIEIRCITLVSNATRNGKEIDVEKASCFAPGNSVRRSISIGSPTKRLREWNGDDEKGNEETDGEYNRTTEWDKKWYRQQKREKRKRVKEKERKVYCYFGITLYLHAQPRTLSSLRSNQIPTFAICAWMPLATSAFTAPSAAIGDSKSTNP